MADLNRQQIPNNLQGQVAQELKKLLRDQIKPQELKVKFKGGSSNLGKSIGQQGNKAVKTDGNAPKKRGAVGKRGKRQFKPDATIEVRESLLPTDEEAITDYLHKQKQQQMQGRDSQEQYAQGEKQVQARGEETEQYGDEIQDEIEEGEKAAQARGRGIEPEEEEEDEEAEEKEDKTKEPEEEEEDEKVKKEENVEESEAAESQTGKKTELDEETEESEKTEIAEESEVKETGKGEDEEGAADEETNKKQLLAAQRAEAKNQQDETPEGKEENESDKTPTSMTLKIGSAKLLVICWTNCYYVLPLIWINIHFCAKYMVGVPWICDLGEEWTILEKAPQMAAGKGGESAADQMANSALKWAEIIILILLDILIAAIIFLIVYAAYAIATMTWVEQLIAAVTS